MPLYYWPHNPTLLLVYGGYALGLPLLILLFFGFPTLWLLNNGPVWLSSAGREREKKEGDIFSMLPYIPPSLSPKGKDLQD